LANNSEWFEADYFPKLAEIEPENFWFRARNKLIVWALRHYFPQAESHQPQTLRWCSPIPGRMPDSHPAFRFRESTRDTLSIHG